MENRCDGRRVTPEKANDNNGFVVKGDVGLPHARSHEVASSAAFRAVSQQSESRGDSPIAFVVIERSRLRRQSRFEIAVNLESVRGQNVDDAMSAA